MKAFEKENLFLLQSEILFYFSNLKKYFYFTVVLSHSLSYC